MKKSLTLIALLLACSSLSVTAFSVRAQEGGAPPAAKADGGKPKGGEEEAKKAAPEGVSGGRFAGDPVYVHLSPMVLPVISDAGVEQLVTLKINIEVKDFDVADNINTNMPRIMDALMTSLYGGLGQGSLRRGKLVDVSKVKVKAFAAIESIVGPDNIKNVLVEGVSQRML